MAEHDNSYKLLFSHARMVEDLLKGFVHEEWIQKLDFSSLEKQNDHFVSDDLRDREDDVIWRVRFGDNWLYVYLLIEFQSSVDIFMGVRIMTYLGLLYQDLIRQNKLTENGKLPPVLPLVLYNGDRRWTAKTNIEDLIETAPGGLENYMPQLSYLLLDEGALDEIPLLAVRNLAAALFRLEKSDEQEATGEIIEALVEWLKSPEQTGLRRAFTIWISRVLLPGRLRGVELPEFSDLHEVKAMLQNAMSWPEQWEQKGIQKGRREGKQEGRQEGRQEGLLLGEVLVLKRLLIRRFGILPDWAESRLEQGETAQLEEWADRVLDAGSLEDVFADESKV